MSKILFLTPSTFGDGQKAMLENAARVAKLNIGAIFYVSLHRRVKDMWIRKGKNKFIWNSDVEVDVEKVLDEYIDKIKPSVIVCNDQATLGFITKKYTSLALCRGSVYTYKKLPVIVLDSVLNIHNPKQKWFAWVLLRDLQKIKRWHENEKRHEPKFRYAVVRDITQARAAATWLQECLLIAEDIETAGGFITCIGFTGVHPSGKVFTYVFPFVNPLKEGACHWETIEDEIQVWQAVYNIQGSEVYKSMQNGQYDSAYFIRYRIPPKNYYLDSLNFFHSIWCEAPKKLNFQASIINDHCRYWKDEAKGDKKDKDKSERVPNDYNGIERYWRYNALDCYHTAINSIFLLTLIISQKWALANYDVEFSSQVGPALAMSMRGMKVNRQRLAYKTNHAIKKSKKALEELRIMCDDPKFNPNSPYEFASLIYDVLGAQPIKMRGKHKGNDRTVDEKVLKLIRAQHPLYAVYIDKVWDVKKPANNASKYGQMYLPNGRFLYQLSAAGTETTRYSGKEHQFWCGTNPQNITKSWRDAFVADQDCVFVELDYRQSDAWFVAFESEDIDYMRNIADDRDTHAVHAEHFFKIPYERIVEAHKTEEDWVDHPTKGVRQNTKRIAHGANYRMSAFTLYVTLGHEASINTLAALGYKNVHLWDIKKIVDALSIVLGEYFKLYKRLPIWFETSVKAAIKNGNRATTAFGHTRIFFGDMAKDDAIQRELSAYFGQGGTAGNINRTLLGIYYGNPRHTGDLSRSESCAGRLLSLEEPGKIWLVTQTHDSILMQFHKTRMHLIPKALTIMEQPCTIKGRTFTVPVDAKIGLSWGKPMMTYREDIKYDELLQKDLAWHADNYSKLINQQPQQLEELLTELQLVE